MLPEWLKEASPYLAIISGLASALLTYFVARGKNRLDAQSAAIESVLKTNDELREDIARYRDEIRELRAQIDASEDERLSQKRRIGELEAEVARLTRELAKQAPAT